MLHTILHQWKVCTMELSHVTYVPQSQSSLPDPPCTDPSAIHVVAVGHALCMSNVLCTYIQMYVFTLGVVPSRGRVSVTITYSPTDFTTAIMKFQVIYCFYTGLCMYMDMCVHMYI